MRRWIALAALVCLLLTGCGQSQEKSGLGNGWEPEGMMPLDYAHEFSVAYYPECLLLTGCGQSQEKSGLGNGWEPEGMMPLDYAHEFSVAYYPEDCKLITLSDGSRFLVVPENGQVPKGIARDIRVLHQPVENIYLAATAAMCKLITLSDGSRFLVVPENGQVPKGIARDIRVLHQPVENIYLAATAAMCLFDGLDRMDSLRLSGTKQEGWYIDSARQAMAQGKLLYAGKYNQPDYELILRLDRMDSLRLSGTKQEGWYIDSARQAMAQGKLLYAGKYNQPDYELILQENCQLAVESTMIGHASDVKQKLEELGIPVLVDQASHETHPLGRTEWIKLYGVLLGEEEKALELFNQQKAYLEQASQGERTGKTVAFFYISSTGNAVVRKSGDYVCKMIDLADQQKAYLEQASQGERTGKTVAFFYISSTGNAVVRKSGDYVCKMIDLAGGEYVFQDLGDPEKATSTVNMEMEKFFATAKDADIIIYNSAISGQVEHLADLVAKNPLLEQFRAVQTGNVWCTSQNMYQEILQLGQMTQQLRQIFTAEDPNTLELSFFTHLV